MKSQGFKNKGMVFTKDTGLFQIEVEIQNQRYYKEENTENFRINYTLFCREFTDLSGKKKWDLQVEVFKKKVRG